MLDDIKNAFNFAFDKLSPILVGWTIGLYFLGTFSSPDNGQIANFDRLISLCLICFCLAFLFKFFQLRRSS